MKVTGFGSSTPARGTKRVDRPASQGSGGFREALSSEPAEGVEEAQGMDAPSALTSVDTLLAVQMAGDVEEREARRRLVRWGEDILDLLEAIRHGLLTGTLPAARLATLAQMVRQRRVACADPRLAALLDEIELRAEVELAKLSRGL